MKRIVRWSVHTWSLPRRAAAVFSVVCFYVLLFILLQPLVSGSAASLGVFPVLVAGWLFGPLGGLLLALIIGTITGMLFELLVISSPLTISLLSALPNLATLIFIGTMTGWLRTLLIRLQEQSQKLSQEQELLHAEIALRKRTEQELRSARDAAETANRAKDTFLANISHELRTPLTSIIGYSELLLLQAPSYGHHYLVDDLTRIRTASMHLLALINDLLDLSRIEAGKISFAPVTFDLASLVHDVAATVQPLVERNQNILHVQCSPTLGSIYADPTRLRQVLFNLLSNAAKFTERGSITIDVYREEPSPAEVDGTAWQSIFVFHISDTGVGMTAEEMERLFQPFTQVNEALARQHGGAGLGLALSRRLCQLMGGDVVVKSQPAQGTSFTIRLPSKAVAPFSVAAYVTNDTSSPVPR